MAEFFVDCGPRETTFDSGIERIIWCRNVRVGRVPIDSRCIFVLKYVRLIKIPQGYMVNPQNPELFRKFWNQRGERRARDLI